MKSIAPDIMGAILVSNMPEFENRHSFDAGKLSAEKERRERNKREKDDELIREVFEYFDVRKK